MHWNVYVQPARVLYIENRYVMTISNMLIVVTPSLNIQRVFMKFSIDNNTLTRGCIKDLDKKRYEFCQKQTDQCHLCWDQDNCNTCIPGRSVNLCSNGILIAIVVLITYFSSNK